MQDTVKNAKMPGIMRISAAIGLAVLAASCTTPQEDAARAQAQMAQLMNDYGPACRQLGYTANTDPWRQCVLHMSTREQLQRMNSEVQMYGGWGPGFGGSFWGPYW